MAHSCPPPGQRKRNHFSGIPTVFISISFFCNVTVCYSCEVAFFFPFCKNDTHESIFSITCFCVDVVSIIEFTYEGLRKLPQFIECVLFFPLISLICFHYQLSSHLPEASVAQNNIGLLWKIPYIFKFLQDCQVWVTKPAQWPINTYTAFKVQQYCYHWHIYCEIYKALFTKQHLLFGPKWPYLSRCSVLENKI